MVALVDHRLGKIERADAGVLEERIVKQRFVHARTLKRRSHDVLERGHDVVGRQHGVLGRLLQTVGAVAHDVGERAGEHAHLAVEGL